MGRIIRSVRKGARLPNYLLERTGAVEVIDEAGRDAADDSVYHLLNLTPAHAPVFKLDDGLDVATTLDVIGEGELSPPACHLRGVLLVELIVDTRNKPLVELLI